MKGTDASRLMRAVSEEVAGRLSAELPSALGKERARFAAAILEYLSADIDVLPGIAAEYIAQYRAAIEQVLTGPTARPLGGKAAEFVAILDGIAPEAMQDRYREIAALRTLAGLVIRALADRRDSDPAIAELGQIDLRWLKAFEQARAGRASPAGPGEDSGGAVYKPLTAEVLTALLRDRFPGSPDLTVTTITPIPGGRSKATRLIDVTGTTELPSPIIMRQDMALIYAGTLVTDEVGPLRILADHGLPVPTPFHFETGPTEAGGPFILMRRLPGSPPGDYFGLFDRCDEAVFDIARSLAKLHAIPVAAFGADVPREDMAALVERYWTTWRDNSVRPSAIIDCAFAWGRGVCTDKASETVYVHGDAGAHNLLVHDGRLAGILDWEFAHLGDPAEDLGVIRAFAEPRMPWPDVMAAYRAAGGGDVEDERIRLGMMLVLLKGCALVATSGRNFSEGAPMDFVKGANAYVGFRQIESRIAALMGQQLGS